MSQYRILARQSAAGDGREGRNMAQVWSLATGEKIGTGMSHPGDLFGIWSIAFSPDGKRIVTGHKDGRIRIFDWQTGKVVGTPLQHSDEVNDVTFTPDGRHLLACVRHGTLHVWDVATGKLAVPFLPSLKPAGGSTQALGIARDRVVVSANALYKLLDLTALVPVVEEDVPTLLRRAELATNHHLQVGELVPLEAHEWSSRWEQLVATRLTPEMATEALAKLFDEATDSSAQRLIVARAVRRGLLERLQRLRPKATSLRFALAFEKVRHGDRADGLEMLTQALDELAQGPPGNGEPRRSHTTSGLTEADFAEAAQVLTPELPRRTWSILEPTDLSATSHMTLSKQLNGKIMATAGAAAPMPSTYVIQSRTKVGRIAALLLEALPHASLPNRGSGHSSGNSCLAEVRIRVRRSDGTQTHLKLAHAASDFVHPLDECTTLGDGPWGAIDGDNTTRWDIWPEPSKPHWLMMTVETPVDIAADDTLIVELDSGQKRFPLEQLGHFRLSASAEMRSSLVDDLMAAIRQRHLAPRDQFAAACLLNMKSAAALNALREEPPPNNRSTLARTLLLATALQQLGQHDEAKRIVKELVGTSDVTGVWQRPHRSLTGFVNLALHDFAQLSENDIAKLFEAPDKNAMSTPSNLSQEQLLALGRIAEAARLAEDKYAVQLHNRIRLMEAVALYALANDIKGYQKTCEMGISNFTEKLSAEEAERLTKACLLLPGAIDPSRLPVKSVRDAIDDPTQASALNWFAASSALAAYRSGDVALSLKETNRATSFDGQVGALLLSIRALAQEKLGQHKLAMESLQQAEAAIPKELAALGREPNANPIAPSSLNYDWLIAEVLRREAERVVRIDGDATEFARAGRRDQLAAQGKWAEAAKEFISDLHKAPGDRGVFVCAAAMLMMNGDIEGHRRFCDRDLQQFLPVTNPDVADSLCKACLLVPNAIEHSRLPIKVLREGITSANDQNASPYYIATNTLILYRAGQFAAAIEETKKIPSLKNVVGSLALVVRAMSEEKLGQHEAALMTLKEVETMIPAELRTLGTPEYRGRMPVPFDTVSSDWLIPEVLRREAEKLLSEKK